MRLVLATRYPAQIASSRERLLRLRPYFERAGLECEVAQLYPDEYPAWDGLSRVARARAVVSAVNARARALRRVGRAARDRATVVLAQYELLPYVPALLEAALLPASVPLVIDYDDAWHHHYDRHDVRAVRAVLGNKIGQGMRRAAGVSAGSAYLASYAARWSDNVAFVPTALTLEDYPAEFAEEPGFVVGWLGSPSTSAHLEPYRDMLLRYLRSVGGRLLTVGEVAREEHDDVQSRLPWTPDNAAALYRRMHVGVMPLPDTPFTRGKCAYKLLQYLAAWRPVVASPVGENVTVVGDSGAGFLATSPPEWVTALDALRTDPERRAVLGRRGRAFIAGAYTHDIVAGRLLDLIRSAVPRRSVRGSVDRSARSK